MLRYHELEELTKGDSKDVLARIELHLKALEHCKGFLEVGDMVLHSSALHHQYVIDIYFYVSPNLPLKTLFTSL